MSRMTVQMIPVSSIKFPSSARSVDEEHARKIAATIPDGGDILQPIGVVAHGVKYRGIWGHHRLCAYQLLRRSEIPAQILPEGTPPEDEAKHSLIENSVRREETFDDTIRRVAELAKQMNCSMTKAAKLAHVKPAYLSRCRVVDQELTPEARALAKHHKFGISLLYLVASKARTPEQQLTALKALASGKTRDEVERSLMGRAGASSRRKKINLTVCIGETKIRLTLPSDTEYEHLDRLLKQLRKKLLANKNVPVALLPQILR